MILSLKNSSMLQQDEKRENADTIHCAFFIGTHIQVEHKMAAGRTG